VSGYYVTRNVRTPEGAIITRRVWVDTTAETEAAQAEARRRASATAAAARRRRQARVAAAKRRAANAARAAASRAAQRRADALRNRRLAEARAEELRERAAIKSARELAIQNARKASFEALHQRNKEAFRRRALAHVQPPRAPEGPARQFQDTRASLEAERLAQRKQQAINQQVARAKDSASREAEARKQLLLQKLTGDHDRLQMNAERGARGLKKDTTSLVTGKDIKDIEKVLEYESSRADKGQFDVENVEKLREAYEKHAAKVADDYEEDVAKVNAALDKFHKTQNPADYEKAKKLYAEYLKSQKEFQRLFGNGRDAMKDGAYNKFYQQYQNIGVKQRDWWKNQMKSQLQKTAEGYDDRPGRDNSNADEARELLAIINGTAKTRRVADGVDAHRRPKYRYFTIEEELAARQAEKIMQAEKLRAVYMAQQRNIKIQMMHEGYTEYKGQYVERAQLPVIQDAESVMNRLYGGKFDPARPHDIHEFVDKMLADWERKHPKPPSGRSPEAQLALRNWSLNRQDYENSSYKFFGLGPQGILEKGLDTPGIRDALALLSAPFSGIGAAARVANKAAFGESTIGGVVPNYLDAPEELKKRVDDMIASVPGLQVGLGGTIAKDLLTQKLYAEWVKTAAGQKFVAEETAKRRDAEITGDRQFATDFYGQGNSFMHGIEALNKYGSSPFQNEGANLLASLLLDPLNAVPLKFTTYLARGKYAIETAGKASKFKPLVGARSFIGVDEGTLSLWKHLRSVEKHLSEVGMTRERFLDELRQRVAGVKPKGRASAVQDFLREVGLNPAKVNESQLYNLIELAVRKRVEDKGLDLFTQSKQLTEKRAAARKVFQENERLRREQTKREAQRVAESMKVRRADASSARQELASRRAAQQEQLTKDAAIEQAAAERARQAGAAGAVAGPPRPARKSPEEVLRADGPVDNAVDATISKRVAKAPQRKLDASDVYNPADEFYTADSLGNRLPVDSRLGRDKDYRRLVGEAKKGDADAVEAVRLMARRDRNRFRMESQDLRFLDPKARVRWQPTDYDVAEAAAVSDAAATARLNAARRTIRQAKRALGRKRDEWVSSITRPDIASGDKYRFTEANPEFRPSTLADEMADLPTDRLPIGREMVESADASARGRHGLYEVFSHDNLQYYTSSKSPVAKELRKFADPKYVGEMTTDQFTKFVSQIGAAAADLPGPGIYRDAGQWLFEVFHQLRLAGEMDKLREFSAAMTAVLDDDVTNLYGWMWKVMEDRAGLSWAFFPDRAHAGFLDAAEAYGLHGELALAMIPYGYAATQPPLSFGLTAKLADAAERADWFDAAPRAWRKSENLAANEISKIAASGGQTGSASAVIHYFSTKYGDFVKAGRGWARTMDELGWLGALDIGPAKFVEAVLKRHEHLPPELLELAARRRTPVETFFSREVEDTLNKWGRGNPSNPRPHFDRYRKAIEAAYWAGDLPVRNAEFHRLMFLMKVQMDADQALGAALQYTRYMKKIGKLDEAKQIVKDVMHTEFATDRTRMLSSIKIGKKGYKSAGKLRLEADGTMRMKLWEELGLTPDAAKAEAYARGRQEAVKQAERELADQAKRDTWLADEAVRPADAYAGTIDHTNVAANLESLAADLKQAVDPELRQQLAKRGAGQLRSLAYKLIDTGGQRMTNDVMDDIIDTLDDLKGIPEMNDFFRQLNRELGEMTHGERLKFSSEPLAYEKATLQLRILWGKRHAGMESVVRELEDRLARVDKVITGAVRPVDRAKIDAAVTKRMESVDAAIAKKIDDIKVAPEPAIAADTAPLGAAQELLARISKMTEQQWYDYARAQVGAQLAKKNLSKAVRSKLAREMRQIELAELALQIEKGRGTLVRWQDRADFRRRVLKLFGSDAEEYIAPKMVAPYVEKAQDAVVEQARTYYRVLQQAAGFDVSGVPGIKVGGETVDHLPLHVYRDLDARIADAISEARGYKADTRTRRRSRAKEIESEKPLGRMTDSDPVVVEAKRKALVQYFKETGTWVPEAAYDEARRVLWRGHVQNLTAQGLLVRAQERAAKGLGGTDVGEIYLKLRARLAKAEARKQLGGMAFGEMYGMDPSLLFGEFVARYTDDGTIRHFTPELSTFQRRTLEEHFAALSNGIKHTDDEAGDFLRSANEPPLQNRELTRGFLQRIGAWSPRKAEEFVAGAKSWSIFDEAKYWEQSYGPGAVPEWTDPQKLAGEFNAIFDDHAKYLEFHKQQGVFSRSHELELRLDGKTMAEIEEAVLRGDPELNLPARRELELQRKYAIERFGPLVSKDGKSLDRMPWLMYSDELRRYLGTRTAKGMPEGLIKSEKELTEVEGLIAKAIDQFWDRYMGAAAPSGAVSYTDVFRLASEVQAQLLANPKWARRYRDLLGKGLDAWASFNRWLVFSNPSFMVVNIVDAPIKGAWYRFSRRGLYQRTLDNVAHAGAADGLTPQMFGWDDTPAMYRVKQRPLRERITNPRGLTPTERAVDRALALASGTGAIFPHFAGQAELAMRMRLAKGMWPEVYSQSLKTLGDPELARVAALDFVKKEVNKMWPTAGDGPIERLWNRFVPFASYTVRNKVLWISEAISNPVVLNHIDQIGRYIEQENMREWDADPAHKGQPMPENLRRLIQLPWAPDYYIDLAQFTDASRGLKPLTDTSWQSNIDRLTDWVRLVSPSTLAGIRATFNAFNLFPRMQWKPVLDANGFPTGRYELITVPWAEPWSKEAANLGSVFWFVDAIQTGLKYGINGWDSGEASAMVGQLFFFNAIKTYDKMSVLFGWYKGLSKEDQARFDETDEGRALADWLIEKVGTPRDFKGGVLEAMKRYANDPSAWWHSQDPKWRARVNEGRDKIKAIRDAFAIELYRLTPGTAEYREMKGKMLLAISDVYTQYPELLTAEVLSKTPTEWAKQLQDWQTDKLMDDFMALSRQRPERALYGSSAAYNKAVEAWEHQKQVFLATFPQVRDRLATGIVEVDSVRSQIERQWDTVLSRIAKRNESIEAARRILDQFGRKSAKGAAAQTKLDLLYLQNDLDYSLLERDYAASYFSPEDFKRLPVGEREVVSVLRQPDLIKRARTFLDFDRSVYEKARREGRLDEYLAKAEYGQAMKDATLYAKRGDPFGKFDIARWMAYMQKNPSLMEKYFANNPAKRDEWAKSSWYIEGIRSLWKQAGDDPGAWVKLLKQDKRLLAEFFRRNPGKQAEWARTDAYIRNISVWGKLVGAERWDEANAVWDNLPQWVKDEYYSRHPERRKRAAETAQYLGYMKKWVSFFDAGKEDEGMAYFNSLPKWARERYFKAHPENRLKFENNEKLNKQLRDYFATEKQFRADYLAKNPDFKRWLAKNADSTELERFAILQAYRTIPKDEAWLRRVFRERYPEVFSQEALGERKLKSVYSTLTKHGGILPEFEKWVEEILRTYTEMTRLGKARPVSSYFERDRKAEAEERRRLRSRSAEEVSAG
jgi:hypothetical protein